MSRQARSQPLASGLNMIIPAETIEAYRSTRYDVLDGDNTISLRIGEMNIQLPDLYRRYNVQSSVFITAWNPFGKFLTDEENKQANLGLRKQLVAEGLQFLEGAGIGTDTEWPPEPSLLALGVSQDHASELCRLYRQNAVVYIGPDFIPVITFHPDIDLADI